MSLPWCLSEHALTVCAGSPAVVRPWPAGLPPTGENVSTAWAGREESRCPSFDVLLSDGSRSKFPPKARETLTIHTAASFLQHCIPTGEPRYVSPWLGNVKFTKLAPPNNTTPTPFAPRAGPSLSLDIFCQNPPSLSKTTKLILLDSLLQEVCINSWRGWVAHLRVRSG